MQAPTAWHLIEEWSRGELKDKTVIDDALSSVEDIVALHGTSVEIPKFVKRLLMVPFLNEHEIRIVEFDDGKYGLGNGNDCAFEFDIHDVVAALKYAFESFDRLTPGTMLFSLLAALRHGK